MGVQELIFAFVDMLHMLSYVHQGGGGWGVLTFLTSTSLTLPNTLPLSNVVNTLHMPSYIHPGGGGVY